MTLYILKSISRDSGQCAWCEVMRLSPRAGISLLTAFWEIEPGIIMLHWTRLNIEPTQGCQESMLSRRSSWFHATTRSMLTRVRATNREHHFSCRNKLTNLAIHRTWKLSLLQISPITSAVKVWLLSYSLKVWRLCFIDIVISFIGCNIKNC